MLVFKKSRTLSGTASFKLKPGGDLLSQEGEPDKGEAMLRPGERRELTSERPVPELREGPHIKISVGSPHPQKKPHPFGNGFLQIKAWR